MKVVQLRLQLNSNVSNCLFVFSGDTKYFCVKMLRKVLPEYPEDVIRCSSQFHYRISIDLYNITLREIELLNRINTHHSRWAYTRQPFTALDEIVRVSDFLPFYHHLRQNVTTGSTVPYATNNTSRSSLPQTAQPHKRSNTSITNPSLLTRGERTVSPTLRHHYPPSLEHSLENMPLSARTTLLAPCSTRPARPSRAIANLPPALTLLRQMSTMSQQAQPSTALMSLLESSNVNTPSTGK
jgi:hypothetical protein